VRLRGLDLNLLVALDVLLEERSVSRSAKRLRLSQPAVSAALGRLRDYFNDDLLIQHGKRMIPTAHAESLIPAVKQILASADELISMSNEFDPAQSERLFRVMTSDYITMVLLAPVMSALETTAPRVRLNVRLMAKQLQMDFEQGELDLVIAPEDYLDPKHPAELLFEESFVVVGWAENPLLTEPLTKSQFAKCAHVGVTIGKSQLREYGESYFERMGIKRRIDVCAPSFSVVPWLLIGTHRVAVMQAALARAIAPTLPLKVVPLPVSIPPMREMLQIHSARTKDQGLAWFRDQVRAIARATLAPKPPL